MRWKIFFMIRKIQIVGAIRQSRTASFSIWHQFRCEFWLNVKTFCTKRPSDDVLMVVAVFTQSFTPAETTEGRDGSIIIVTHIYVRKWCKLASIHAGSSKSRGCCYDSDQEDGKKILKIARKIIKTEAWVVYLSTFRATRVYEVEKCKSLANSSALEFNAGDAWLNI